DAQYEITVTGRSGEAKYDGEVKSVEGLIKDTFEVDGNTYTVSGLSAYAEAVNAGTYTVNVTGTPVVTDADGNDVSDQFAVGTINGTLEIAKRQVTLTSASDEKTYDGQALTNDEVTIGGDGFAEGEGASYQFTGSQTEAGSSENGFTYALNEGTYEGNYEITTEMGTLTVHPFADQVTITITENSGEEMYNGTAKTVSGYTVAIDHPLYTENDFTFNGDAQVTGINAGTYEMQLKAEGFTNISPNFTNVEFLVVDGELQIVKRNVTLTSGTDEKIYDGQALTNETVTIGGDGFAEGEGVSCQFTGSQTEAGQSANTFSYTLDDGTAEDNYEISTEEGTLKVTPFAETVTVTITENSGSEKYDGTQKSISGYTVSIDNPLYTEDDFTFSGDDQVTGTNAGTYGMQLSAEDFTNISPNFTNVEFLIVDGELQITKRNVTLTSTSDSREYNGRALTNGDVTISGDGFAAGEGASYEVTGSRLTVGTSENIFTYTLNEGTGADNYDIAVVYGILEVTDREEKYPVTLTGGSAEFLYDGEEKTVRGLVTDTIEIDGNIYTISGMTAETSETDAGSYPVIITGTPVITDADGNDVTDQFDIHPVQGTLNIAKRRVTLTSASDSREYNGRALTNHEVAIDGDGFAEGEGAAYQVTGSQRTVGSSENIFKYTLNEGTKAGNYEIVTSFGTLTVTNRDAQYEITVTGRSGEAKYDGEVKSVEGLIKDT
ncbi:MAG: hypothetical protein IKG01_00660, partial [Lachnospiraceae bacterium]|nr:hypothetical protein [Lachnospiraceae bacterium]